MQRVFKSVLGVWLVAMVLCLALNASATEAQSKVNINEAPVELLQALPGVGPALAQRIVEYREQTPFEAPEDIMKVSGIGEATFEKMKELIVVE
ncbi:helix-hairpin-helix domain-containing protein [Desulfonatronum sp. SC1]|uniref:ComEA family DNA-binding protein n=1 Tax=Desulfonatronum sp. SC1 TaxID=2109626 RepID=UPI000D304DA4|nr:helix-hairpin-helix domain-containing protein [Desulfonatronum sp. SC1]PTN34345.1 competence protein ComEA [Desulfonatronum sp. SC1]